VKKKTPSSSSQILVSKDTLKWLDDTEVVLTHRAVTKVRLRDIYVSCDMKNATAVDVVKSNEVEYINSDVIIGEQNII
jgi:hypothetical protein